jgi:hypothetical protein
MQARFLSELASSCSISQKAFLAALVFYLVEMTTTYLLRYVEDNGVTRNGAELVNSWKSLLALLLREMGGCAV